MHEVAAFDQIKFRAAALRLSLTRLAREAGLHQTTVSRIAAGTTSDPHAKTLARLGEALAKKEAEMRRHLRELERSREGRQLDLVDAVNSITGNGGGADEATG